MTAYIKDSWNTCWVKAGLKSRLDTKEDKAIETTCTEAQGMEKKKQKDNEKNLSDLGNNNQWSNTCVTKEWMVNFLKIIYNYNIVILM